MVMFMYTPVFFRWVEKRHKQKSPVRLHGAFVLGLRRALDLAPINEDHRVAFGER